MKRFDWLVLIVFVLSVLFLSLTFQTIRAGAPKALNTHGITVLQSTEVTPAPTASDVVVLPTGDVVPPDSTTPETAFNLVFALLLSIAGTWLGSPLTTAIVGLLKRFIPDAEHGGISGQALAAGVAVLLWIIYTLAAHFNLADAFKSVGAFLVLIISDFGPLVGVLLGAPAVYQFAKANNVVVMGYSRN